MGCEPIEIETPAADDYTEEAITGDALVALLHSDLKEMGIPSIGHRLTILKSVYDVKIKQNVPIEPDHYVPLCQLIYISSGFAKTNTC